MTNNKDKEKYYEFSVELYTHGIINDNEIKNIKNKYDNVIEKNSKKQMMILNYNMRKRLIYMIKY